MTQFPHSRPPQESTPKGLKSYSPGLAQQGLPWVGSKRGANPVRVASILPGDSRANDPTLTGLGRLTGLPGVAASPQPWAIIRQSFQGCSAVGQKESGYQILRHPERSEANDLFSPSRLNRAQSKDLAAFPSEYRSGTESLHAEPARRHRMEFVPCWAGRGGVITRSFDCGSANAFGKTPAPLAFAQDDGIFKTSAPLAPQFHLGAPHAPRETLFRALFLSSAGSAMKLPQQARSQMKVGNEKMEASVLNCVTQQNGALPKNLRHPERSEANDLFFPSRLTRAQSKDLAAFASEYRSGTESLYTGTARRHRMEMVRCIAGKLVPN
jgi:hypothetical protein